MKNKQPVRVIAYIDGFNLYFGLKDSGYQRFYWLNIQAMIQNLLRKYQQLVLTKYFTARISGPEKGDTSNFALYLEAKRCRQAVFLEALGTLPGFLMYYGHYLRERVKCRNCGRVWNDHEEKMTDVNIATEMLTDAFEDKFDTALLVSADSDLVPTLRALKRLFPQKRIVVFFPPGRSSAQLKNVADRQFTIGRRTLAKSQFSDQVVKTDGHMLERPQQWR
jgi:uncharacterized LabA/DUF88 family protein